MKDLDSLLHLLSEKKKKVEQEEAEINMEVLLDFLHLSRKRKQEELLEVGLSYDAAQFGVTFLLKNCTVHVLLGQCMFVCSNRVTACPRTKN